MKYVLYSGYVTSINDGQEHFVPAHKLVELYGLNRKDCILDTKPDKLYGLDYITLGPRENGDYKEHLEEMMKRYV